MARYDAERISPRIATRMSIDFVDVCFRESAIMQSVVIYIP